MRILLFLALMAITALPATAQDAEGDGKSYLESLIEDALSDGARQVTVSGFEGALSSNATLESLTIADARGVWFTLEDASLVWSRAALLQGRLEVQELTAASVELARLPEAGARVTPKDAEARPFALPDLPVSVSVGTIRADRVRLGAEVLGEAAVLGIEGRLELTGDVAEAALDIRRIGRADRVTLDAGFSDATRILRVDLDFDEAAGGMVSRLLRVPGRPSLRLAVKGEAPLSEFEARVALSSGGARRLGGTVGITAAKDGDGHAFSVALAGDLRPLFIPDLHPFFGYRATLDLAGRAGTNGRLVLDRFALGTGAMEVNGALALAPDGWPERLTLDGRIGGEGRLRLPLTGPATLIGSADFHARFDADAGDAWLAGATLKGLSRDGLRIGRARLDGNGTLTLGATRGLTADISLDSGNMAHDDPALARALGSAAAGRAQLAWQAGAPIRIDRLDLAGGDATLTARGTLGALANGLPVDGRALLESGDLARFAALAGRDIAGRARATLEGRGTLFGGAFDVTLSTAATDLRTGTPRLDPLLAGRSTLDIAARRTGSGTTLDRLVLQGDHLSAQADGRLNARTGRLALTARIADLSRAEPRLSGPARLETRLNWAADGDLTVSRLHAEAAGAVLDARGTVTTSDPDLPATGRLSLTSDDLSRLAGLAGRPLAGQVTLQATGSGSLRGKRADAAISLTGRDLRTGLAELDTITAGKVTFDADLAYGGGAPVINRLSLVTPRLTATARGAAPGDPVALSARLDDLGLLAPGLSGPANLDGTLSLPRPGADATTIETTFTGPGNSRARVDGQIRGPFETLALAIAGQVPLALANGIIAPRSITGPARFDLRLDGPPRLASLSGTIGLDDARVALPSLKSALSGVSGTVTLGGGRARTDLTGSAEAGGRFRLQGPIALSPPFDAGLEITLTELGLRDPELFQTTANGRVNVTGPLAGGARITGALTLGRTELRVPSGSLGAAGALPPITHVAEPAAVKRTRRRAGLIETGPDAAPAAFPLDLVIDAPNRIFVRGRGLDAELGGRLRLGGTTANVRPSGSFSLIRGRIDVLTKRLDLTEGLIDLRGALDPWLRFVATTDADDITVQVILEGLASAPDVRFTSTPDLPQEEILARLLFGRSFSKMSAFQAAQLVGAAATLSGRGGGGLTGTLRDTFGLSDFDVTTTAGGATEFSAGAYISENIYSQVATDSEGRNRIELNLDLSRSVTVKGRADSEGDTGIGVFFEKDY